MDDDESEIALAGDESYWGGVYVTFRWRGALLNDYVSDTCALNAEQLRHLYLLLRERYEGPWGDP